MTPQGHTCLTVEEIRAKLDADPFLEDGYLREADRLLEENGYVCTGAPCGCDDGGEYGHEFWCGYQKEVFMSLPDTQAEQDRRLRLDLKRRLKLAGFLSDLTAISDVTLLRQLLVQQVPYGIGQRVEIQFADGWIPGTFVGYVQPQPEEDFRRISVDIDGSVDTFGLPPERVRPVAAPKSGGIGPDGTPALLLDPAGFDARQEGLRRGPKGLIGPFPQEPAPGSPEAVQQAAETITPQEEAQPASSFAVGYVRAEADRAWDRVARERDRADAFRQQRDELADALEVYVRRERAALAHPSMSGARPSRELLAAEEALRKAGRS